jgi:integrase
VARKSSPVRGKTGIARLSVVQPTADVFARLVDDYVQEKRAAGASPRTVGHYREVLERVLIPFCVDRQIKTPAELTPRHLHDLGAGLLDGTGARSGRAISKATVHSYMRAINTFLGWAHAEGEGSAARGKLPTMRRRVLETLSREEVDRLEDAAETERDKLIVRLLADTGMRLGELLALRPRDIRVEGQRHVIMVQGKGDRERLVPITPGFARRLRRFADRSRSDARGDRIFITLRRGRSSGKFDPITKSAVEQMIRAMAEKAGISKRVYPHLLRHSFATDYLRRGGNPILLQQILGHSSLAMITQTYQHLTISDAHDELMRILLGEPTKSR